LTGGVRVLVVDDLELARQKLVRSLSAHPDVEVVGEAASGEEMIDAIRRLHPALLFLDVSMPEQDGFSALRELPPGQRPVVIFLTAYAQFALEAFRVDAVDYLLKPVDPTLLATALMRARRRLKDAPTNRDGTPTSVVYPLRLTLRTDSGLRLLPVDTIDWIEAVRNHLAIHCGREVIIVRLTLQNIVTQLEPKRFARVHRSAVVNLARVRELRPVSNGDQRMVLIDGTELPISRTHREAVLRLLAVAAHMNIS
jgi:two-component system, LytTR family, response regulator